MCQCPHCNEQGLPASVVDHKKKHNGDPRLFFDPRNLRSMAKPCHDRFKQSEEKGGAGFLKGSDELGRPLDPAHPWHAADRQP
jgi:5-methylcytosine-specific restriction enzyme A